MGNKIITVTFDDYDIHGPEFTLIVPENEVAATLVKLQEADGWGDKGGYKFEVHDADPLEFVLDELRRFHEES